MTGGGTPRTLKLPGRFSCTAPFCTPMGVRCNLRTLLGPQKRGWPIRGQRGTTVGAEKKELQQTSGARGLPAPTRVGRTFPAARAGGGPASRSSRGSPGARKAPRPGACCYTAATTRTPCTSAAARRSRPGRPPHHAPRVNKPPVGGTRRSSANGRAGGLQGAGFSGAGRACGRGSGSLS